MSKQLLVPEDQYKRIMRRNGAHSRGGVSKERKAALARATEMEEAMVQKSDIGAVCVVNGMGETDDAGSYIKIFIENGDRNFVIVSKGAAEGLRDQIAGLLSVKLRIVGK